MTVLDSSAVVDLLLDTGVGSTVDEIIKDQAPTPAVAPDVLVFEVVAVLRRHVLRGEMDPERAGGALEDLGGLNLELIPTLPLRERAWALRGNFTAADAMYVALAEQLREPLATRDKGLVAAVHNHTGAEAVHLSVES